MFIRRANKRQACPINRFAAFGLMADKLSNNLLYLKGQLLQLNFGSGTAAILNVNARLGWLGRSWAKM
jgi:hypothetical protein